MKFDPLEFKQHFPLFQVEENQSLIYFDNAATTQKPQAVIDAIGNYYLLSCANANRSSHRLARKSTNLIAHARKVVANFIGAQANEVIFTSGATESINTIAFGLKEFIEKDDEIVLSIAEHHANLLPWQVIAKDKQAGLRFMSHQFDNIFDVVNQKSKILSLTLASNTLGNVFPIDQLKKIKKQFPSLIIVIDASQYIAHFEVDVKSLCCDFLAFSAHKVYGPTGLGVLFVKDGHLPKLKPLKVGGEMIEAVDKYTSVYAEDVRRLEAGTSPLSAIATMPACLDFINQWDRQLIHDHEQDLLAHFYEGLFRLKNKFKDLTLLSHKENNIGIVALSSDAYSMYDLGVWLDEHNVAVRVGDLCAQPLWKSLGVNHSVLRFSIAAYNSFEDINNCLHLMEEFFSTISDLHLFTDKTQKLSAEKYNDSFINEFLFIDWQLLFQKKPWQQRYKTIIQWGQKISEKPWLRSQEFEVSACESLTWFACKKKVVEVDDGKKEVRYYFAVDSDSLIVKGLAALLICRCYGKSAQEILSVDFDAYFNQLGLEKHLSPSRLNGIAAIVQKIQSAVDKN
jgi:SufS family cysteine desulfurase